MDELRYTLVADGSSDRALIPIINWVLRENGRVRIARGTNADFRRTRKPKDLAEKLLLAVELFPCDMLFVHRDAERQDAASRYQEIAEAAKTSFHGRQQRPYICVVPIRMQEAWLLIDEAAIREAAGNPNGTTALSLPTIGNLESLSDPKTVLHRALKLASGRQKRRLKSFDTFGAAALVPEYVTDFSPLRKLSAFQRLESDIQLLSASGWRIPQND